MVGVAPHAHLASWVIHQANGKLVSDEQLMDMFQYASNTVAVQNHSWGHVGLAQQGRTLLEDLGISNAVTHGRGGLGVVMVRSAGNDRDRGANANDDGYCADPRVIPVAAVRQDGRATTYSEPGACILVAAPSGDVNAGFDNLFTTDLTGTGGINQLNFFPPFADMNNYAWGSLGFGGTSAAAPQIAGLVALMLAANPGLSYRDVQQILILAARHYDFADPDLRPNGAGFLVSHNVGFGVPDAGEAVRLAQIWSHRPPAARHADGHEPRRDSRRRLSFELTAPSAAGPRLGACPAQFGGRTRKRQRPLVRWYSSGRRPTLRLISPITERLSNAVEMILPDRFSTRPGGRRSPSCTTLPPTFPVSAPGRRVFAPMIGTDFVPLPSGFITTIRAWRCGSCWQPTITCWDKFA